MAIYNGKTTSSLCYNGPLTILVCLSVVMVAGRMAAMTNWLQMLTVYAKSEVLPDIYQTRLKFFAGQNENLPDRKKTNFESVYQQILTINLQKCILSQRENEITVSNVSLSLLFLFL